MKLQVHSDVIMNCILSCNTSEQLAVCADMIEHFIKRRFANNIEMPFEHHKLCRAMEERRAKINTVYLFNNLPEPPYDEHEYILNQSQNHVKNY